MMLDFDDGNELSRKWWDKIATVIKVIGPFVIIQFANGEVRGCLDEYLLLLKS